MFEGVVLKALGAGGVRAEFEERRQEQPADIEFDDWETLVGDEDELDLAEEEGGEESELTALQTAIEARDFGLRVLWAYAQAFQSQVDFLRYVREAPEGIDPDAAEQWFTRYLVRLNSTGFDAPKLIQWLLNNGLLEVTPEGRYILTALGDSVAALPDQYWTAPKLF
jgi:hypothetical protein